MAALTPRRRTGPHDLRAARRACRVGLYVAAAWGAIADCGAHAIATETPAGAARLDVRPCASGSRPTTPDLPRPEVTPFWSSTFATGVSGWPHAGANWGDANRSFFSDPAIVGRAMRVSIAKGSTDPATMQRASRAVAGQGMKLKPAGFASDNAWLSFKLRLPADFKPALGGKLGPGLCGGACNGGGRIPDGADGWSARMGFDERANATVYAYLPSSVGWGTVIGRIPVDLGVWTTIVQEVKLNTVGQADGYIRAWANGKLVIDKGGIVFRTTSTLKIDGIYFDTFYGGQSAKFAAPEDTAIEFAQIALYAC